MATVDGKGYVFPDQIDPGDLYCFRVYVPKHAMYLAAFWGAYQFFATWLAWARDPLKRGRLVAQVWKSAIDKARSEFEATRGECMANITGIRQNPLKACEVQVQYDGGAWVTALDMSCCSGGGGGGDCVPPLRLGEDGSIQVSHDGGATWDNTAPGVGVTSEQNIDPPYTDDPEGRCKAANAYLGYTKNYLENLLQNAGTALTYGDFLLQAMDWLLLIFGYIAPVLTSLSATLQGIYTAEGAVNEARLAAKDDMVMICYFLKAFNADGSTEQGKLTRLEADLRAAGAAEADEDVKWWWVHVADLVNIFGVGGAQKAATYDPVNPEDCTTCGYTVHIDFTTDKGPFRAGLYQQSGTVGLHNYGKWIAGEGWVSTPDGPTADGVHRNLLTAWINTDPMNIGRAKIWAHWELDGLICPDQMNGYEIALQVGRQQNAGALAGGSYPYQCPPDPYVDEGTDGNPSVTELDIWADVGLVGGNSWGNARAVVTAIEFDATGICPDVFLPFIV